MPFDFQPAFHPKKQRDKAPESVAAVVLMMGGAILGKAAKDKPSTSTLLLIGLLVIVMAVATYAIVRHFRKMRPKA